MNLANTFSFILLLFILPGCLKEQEEALQPVKAVQSELSLMATCDDTSAFKSDFDLQQLYYLKDCYLATATKEVPGLGSIPWTANCYAFSNGTNLGINLTTYLPWFSQMYTREGISFSGAGIDVGYYPINGGNYIRLLSDGDVGDAYWKMDTLCNNFIEITQIDWECKEVKGNFEIHFIMTEQGQIYSYSERINFINGKFESRIKIP